MLVCGVFNNAVFHNSRNLEPSVGAAQHVQFRQHFEENPLVAGVDAVSLVRFRDGLAGMDV